jgi:uncharacterized protein (TIGR02284 family)
MNNQRVVKVLAHLCRIVEAGERGYAVAAANVSNRALKILFQTFAQQRANFKDELIAEMQRLGGHTHASSSFLGLVHRGRIDIFAALTIGAENVEKVVLKEVMIGERVALATYERSLKKDLPSETRAMILRQFEEVRKVVDQVRLMRGRNGKRLVIRLYDSKTEAERALRSLKEAMIPENEIEMEYLNPEKPMELYTGRGSTILETIASGAVGGGIWGTVAGILAAVGIFQMASFGLGTVTPSSLQLVVVMSILGLIAGGSFVGSMIGLFLGWGIASEDRYTNTYTLKNGQILMRATVDKSLASTAWQILNQVAVESRALRASAHPV